MTAKEIGNFSNSFEILNSDQEICTLSKNVKFSMELSIEKGRGYVTSEENKSNSSDVNFISIDSVFTPIINVKYNIENTRVEQKTDFEKLVIDIQTDGSIHPEDALKGAAQVLIKHFYLFSDKDMEFAEDDSDELEVVEQTKDGIVYLRKECSECNPQYYTFMYGKLEAVTPFHGGLDKMKFDITPPSDSTNTN